MPVQPKAFFLPAELAEGGQRFCLFYPAEWGQNGGAARGLVLYIHPFAEEMNKARRMAALQARALAQGGYSVLQIDLSGCGDSSGDFGDATWKGWVNDVVQGCHWLRGQSNIQSAASDNVPLWLWGLRAGCLLAVEASGQLVETCNFYRRASSQLLAHAFHDAFGLATQHVASHFEAQELLQQRLA